MKMSTQMALILLTISHTLLLAMGLEGVKILTLSNIMMKMKIVTIVELLNICNTQIGKLLMH